MKIARCIFVTFVVASALWWNVFGDQQQEPRRNRMGGDGGGILDGIQRLIPSFGFNGRQSRFLPLFTFVQFSNQECMGATGDNGTCLTSTQCSQRGGSSSGPCAGGYGVCCVFLASCGATVRENGTYFVQSGYPAAYDGTGSCQITLMKANADICQYRLDFDQFQISGPETTNHICNNDQFIVSGGNPVPPICGQNSGNHVYIDAGSGVANPVKLAFVTSGPSFRRNWKVRVTQIPCSAGYRATSVVLEVPTPAAVWSPNLNADHSHRAFRFGDQTAAGVGTSKTTDVAVTRKRDLFCNVAEDGCLQYFTGVAGQITSFNYEPATGLHLSNQDYSICVRTERNFCGIQYTQCPDIVDNRTSSFTITGNTAAGQVQAMVGSTGQANFCPTDYVIIPMATNVGRPVTTQSQNVDRICGGTLSADITLTSNPVRSTAKPFRIYFHSDATEAPTDIGNRGFCLNYVQLPCTSSLM